MDINIRDLKQAVRLAERRARVASRVDKIDTQLARIFSSANGSNGTVRAGAKRTYTRRKPAPPVPAPKPKRRVKVSAKVSALRKAQGRYMGYMRGLKASEKKLVKKTFKTDGIHSAITQAKGFSETTAS